MLDRFSKVFRAGTLAALALSLAGCASFGVPAGSPTLERIASTRQIVIGHREAAVPFSFEASGGQPAGYSVDLCARVVAGLARQLGVEGISIRWTRVGAPDSRVSAVADGRVDMECGVTSVTLTRMRSVDFSSAIFVDGASMLILASAPKGRGDGGLMRVGVIPGTTTESAVRGALLKAGLQATIVPVQDHADGVRALTATKIDAYAADRTVLLGLAVASQNRDNLVVSDRQFSFEPFAIALPRNDPDFRLAVNRQIARIFGDGSIGEVHQRWLGPFGEIDLMNLAAYRLGALPD